jgi:glycosyltransferase involved in cell wall biosynthesis
MSQPAAILHVVDSLETGGLERVVTDLAVAQQAAGHRVAVFSIEATGGFRAVLEAAGVPVVVGGKRGTLDVSVLRALRRACRGVDVVHTHNFVPNYYAALAMLALPRAPVLVNTCHNMGTRLANRRLRALYVASLRRTARVAMVSRQVRDRLVEIGAVDAARATIVLNGIPVERFSNAASRRAVAREMLGLPADAPVIGCVGRLVPVKNHAGLIAELPALAVRHPGLRVVLLGDGPLETELRAQATKLGVADRINIGAQADVAAALPAFDVYAQPSLSEGMSIALLEACATGLAIVATAVGGNPDIIADGRTGVLVPANDGAALRAALDDLLGNAARRVELGSAAAEWVARHASIEFMRDAYAALYASVRDARGGASLHARANG